MKRYCLLVTTLISAIAILAETNIQKTFLGNTLGNSTSKEVLSVMNSQGFKLLDSNTNEQVSEYSYEGYYKHEGMEFHKLHVRFLNDTLFLVCFQDSCGEQCPEYAKLLQTSLESKYGKLEIADSTFLFKTLTDSADYYGVKTWSRHDEHTMLITMQSDAKITCLYADEDAYWNMVFNGLKQLSEAINTLPDYSEENKVYGVAGVKFGDDMATVRKAISVKSDRLSDSDSHTLTYYKTKIGGTTYDFATFYFIPGKGLVSVNLQNAFYSWRKEEALMAFDGVISQFKRKYTNFKMVNDGVDEKLATCGAYIDGYDYPPIVISFQKSLSKGGDIMYYVMVSYYEMRKSSLYDDEI